MSGERFDDEPAHAPFGPSAANGWSSCLDYVNANRGLPDNAGEAAAEGTFAHMISEHALLLGLNAHDFIGDRCKVRDWTFTWDYEDAELLQRGIDWVRRQGGELFNEHRVDIATWTIPGQFGTLDRAILVAHKGEWWIIINDLKWGRGIAVSPVRNKQLILYALGFWETVKHRFEDMAPPRFMLVIDQPRCPGGGGFWETTLDELVSIGSELKQAAVLGATMPFPPRAASELGCMWCKRKVAPGGCNVYEIWRLKLLGLDITDLDGDALPALAGAMTPERRAVLLLHRSGIERWLKTHDELCMQDAHDGKPIGDLKLVVDTRKGTRDKWLDEKAADSALEPILGAQRFTFKLKTPRQMRIHLDDTNAGVLTDLFVPGMSGFSLVPPDDARAAVASVSADDFEDL